MVSTNQGTPSEGTYLLLLITHLSPSLSRQNALPSGLRLAAKDFLDKNGIAANTSQEHEVRAEWFLRRIGILDVCTTREARLALGSPKLVLTLDVAGGESALPSG